MFIRRKRFLSAACIVALVLAAVGGLLGYRAAQSQTSWVAKVNGETITTANWNSYQTVTAGRGVPDAASLDKVIDQRLQLQEAARRGLTCSTADTAAYIHQYDQTNRAAGWVGEFGLLYDAYANGGFATQAMLSEAATAQAVPASGETAITAYESAPQTVQSLAPQCTLAHLVLALAGPTPDGGAAPQSPQAPATSQPGALQTLTANLRAEATIELAATPTVTATPAP
jgi:hypothetical protein